MAYPVGYFRFHANTTPIQLTSMRLTPAAGIPIVPFIHTELVMNQARSDSANHVIVDTKHWQQPPQLKASDAKELTHLAKSLEVRIDLVTSTGTKTFQSAEMARSEAELPAASPPEKIPETTIQELLKRWLSREVEPERLQRDCTISQLTPYELATEFRTLLNDPGSLIIRERAVFQLFEMLELTVLESDRHLTEGDEERMQLSLSILRDVVAFITRYQLTGGLAKALNQRYHRTRFPGTQFGIQARKAEWTYKVFRRALADPDEAYRAALKSLLGVK